MAATAYDVTPGGFRQPTPQSRGANAASPSGGHDPASPASSTTSDGSLAPGRGEPPKRLRYWLIDMINGGTIPGLQWENVDRTVFRIPWKHAGKNNWREDDCRIFKAWAEHRGKYKPGDKLDAATWKTRLRCALNKLPDIKELKDLSNLEGSDPYRVYQLLPEADRNQEFEIYPRNTWGRESSPPNHVINQHNPYAYERRRSSDLVMAAPLLQNGGHDAQGVITQGNSPRPPSSDPTQAFSRMRVEDNPCYQVNHLDIVAPPPPYDVTQSQRSRNVSNEPANQQPQNYRTPMTSPIAACDVIPSNVTMEADGGWRGIDQSMSETSHLPDKAPPPHEMEIYIRYRGSDVIACHVTEPQGCRVHYGNANWQLMASATHDLPSTVFGPVTLQQIELVDCEPYAQSEKQVEYTKHVLSNIKRGLILYYENGCFYAKRLCQSRVFILGPESREDHPEKLDRKEPLKVFDYRMFCDRLRKYAAKGRGNTPETEVKASFGQNWSMKVPIEKNLVTLYMIPRAARYLLLKMRERHSQVVSLNDESLLDSGPDSYDRLAAQATSESVQCFDDIMKQLTDGPGSSFFDLINSAPEPPQPQAQPQVTPYQSGFFQQNVLNPPPIVQFGDVEMEVNGM